MVVLGRCCSRAYGTYGIGFDGIYFLDDATSFFDVMRAQEKKRQYPCSDMGRRSLLLQEFQRIFPERSPSEYSRPVWFFHWDAYDSQDIVCKCSNACDVMVHSYLRFLLVSMAGQYGMFCVMTISTTCLVFSSTLAMFQFWVSFCW